jgi:hypothetical protein
MIFQVTGLPRSGTAFLASFLNLHPQCFCHHDIAAERDDWKEYSERLEGKWRFVGESSTYGWFPRAQREGVPRIFIHRPFADIVKSLIKFMRKEEIPVSSLMRGEEVALDWARRLQAQIIPFNHLFDVRTLEQVWSHIFRETGSFPVEKAEIFVAMNIQRNDIKETFLSPEAASKALSRLF